jgi:hypothetical protein
MVFTFSPDILLWEADDHLVALQGRSEAETDTGVAARRLDEHVPRRDAPVLLRLLDHALRDAVLD